ncbi:MAG: hypothetical protein V1859_09830 [archaeon]
MNKKAYLKTIEVIAAAIITTVFLLVFIPQQSALNAPEYGPQALDKLTKSNYFRNYATERFGCIYSNETSAIAQLVSNYVGPDYDFTLCIGYKGNIIASQGVFVDSYFLAGNETNYSPKTLWLYTWVKK